MKYENEKRILFICSPFFGYYKHIINELKLQGYTVDYYNDRPSENSFLKGIIKIKKNIVDKIIENYFENIIIQTSKKKYDKVLIVNGKVFTYEMISRLKDTQKSARFLFYTWDSLELYPGTEQFISLFDKSYSFDGDDCARINNLSFLPLFYTRPYEEIGRSCSNEEREYDIVSICTAHPNRYNIINGIFPLLKAKGIKIFSYMFLNRLQYLYNKVFISEFKSAKMGEFKFKPLGEKENLRFIFNSNIVFDIPHNKQSGLTMRTIETLGAKRKLITTNKNIKKYDFYDENNIFVLEEDNLDGIEEFINNKYDQINEKIYVKYSLNSWLDTILNEKDSYYFK